MDWARGVAALAMIEGHAVHAWTRPEDKLELAYAATRVLATAPLPAFLLLSGMAVRLRLGAAATRDESPQVVRGRIVRRGMAVLLWGYAASAAYALIDGHDGLRTFLRSDVLHVIGLSIAALALLCCPATRPIDTRSASRRALWLSLALVVLSPVYYRFAPTPSGALGYLLAPFVHVPGISVFTLLPMLAWSGLGFVGGDLLFRARTRYSEVQVYGSAACLALLVAAIAQGLTDRLLGAQGVLDHVHLAGIPNTLGYAARGLLLIGVAPLLVRLLPSAVQAWITRLGQASLVAYVFHIPFCYGAPGAALRGSLSVLGCMPFVVLLVGLSYGAVVAAAQFARLWGKSRAAVEVRQPG